LTPVNYSARVLLLSAAVICQRPAFCQAFSGVLTQHNDNARTGQNQLETILTTANVDSKQFGKVFSYSTKGQTYAQPLYVPGVKIPGKGMHNVVYVATEHDQVYAFDADGLTTKPLWHDSFINSAQGVTTVSTQNSPCPSIKPEVGITSTPVVDASSGTLYVSAETDEKGTVVQRVHALDIATGSEKFGGPVVVQALMDGVAFDPTLIQRPGLLLESGTVYLGYASLCDPHPYHGWLLGYNAQNLQQQTAAFITTPNGTKGGIWQSGGGLGSDGKSIYFMAGDGTFDAHSGGIDYGMSMMRMSVKGGGLTVADYFTPFNWAERSAKDLDLGSGGVLLLPTQAGTHPDEIIGADKSGDIFVVDRQHMGKFHSKSNDVVQQLHGAAEGYRSSPAYWQQNIYYAGIDAHLSMYSITDGLLSPKPVSTSKETFPYPGATPSVSSNGASAGIVWIVQMSAKGGLAILRAYDATNLSRELYNSNQAGSRDRPGKGTRFAVPSIANGRVYIGTQAKLTAYGLLP
jgi:hypothetical protein